MEYIIPQVKVMVVCRRNAAQPAVSFSRFAWQREECEEKFVLFLYFKAFLEQICVLV